MSARRPGVDGATPERSFPPDPAREALKRAFGAFPTGVTVVATAGEAGPVGFTANSFTSVSLDPPLLLVCHGTHASSHAAFRAAGGFSVNVLAADQGDLARRFASRVPDRFEGVRWRSGAGGPLIDGTAAWFDCRTHSMHEAGDHTIMVGRVVDHGHEERDALAYWRGQFLSNIAAAIG